MVVARSRRHQLLAGVPRIERLAVFQAAFETIGYSITADGALEGGYEKVAFFAVGTTPTHAARQLPSGLWSSKLGQLEDISHHLEGVESTKYGSVAFYMRRAT